MGWLAACAAAGVAVALGAAALAMRRVVVPLHGVADGLSQSATNADRLKSAFVANMSHEIRTPLNSVLALSQLLRDGVAGPLTTDQRKYLEIIAQRQTLLRLIDDILDLSRIESGHLEVDTRTSISRRRSRRSPKRCRRSRWRRISTSRSSCPTNAAGPLRHRSGSSDLDQPHRNAIKFTDAGTVRVTAEARPAAVAINVTDTGVGIPRGSARAHLDEFVQVDQTLARRQGGTGLGLAIASRLARLMGGGISRLQRRPAAGPASR